MGHILFFLLCLQTEKVDKKIYEKTSGAAKWPISIVFDAAGKFSRLGFDVYVPFFLF